MAGLRGSKAVRGPTDKEKQWFSMFAAGMKVEEIAKREDVPVEFLEEAFWRVRRELEQYSSENTLISARKMFRSLMPMMEGVLKDAAKATKPVTMKVLVHDAETGKLELLEETEKVPDHDIRLKAHAEWRQIIAASQPKEPSVAVNVNSQTNIANGQLQSGNGQPALTSPEAVIRQIRAERGYALTDGSQPQEGELLPVIEVDDEDVEDEDEVEEDGDGE